MCSSDLRRFLQEIDGTQEGTLATARRANNGNHFALLDGSGNAFQDFVVAEALAKSFYLDYLVFVHII